MTTSNDTGRRHAARSHHDLRVVGGAAVAACVIALMLALTIDETPGLASDEGGGNTCTAATAEGAGIGTIVTTQDDAHFELRQVTLVGADNLSLVEARAVAIPEERQAHGPFGTDSWPLSRDGQWWWDEARRQQGPLNGDIGILMHVTRPDPSRAGTSEALEIRYTSDGRSGALERPHSMRVTRRC